MRVLRWIFVLPAAAIAGLLVSFPIHWLTLILFRQNGLLGHFLSSEGVERFGYSLVVPATIVLAGSAVAPAFRARTALALTSLILTALLAGLYVAMTSQNVVLTDSAWLLALKILALAASLSFALYRVCSWEAGGVNPHSPSAPPVSCKKRTYLEGFASRRTASAGPQGYDVPFDASEVEWFHRHGNAAIRGHATGPSVSLIPRSRYAERHMWTVFGNMEGASFPADALVELTAGLPKTEMHKAFNAVRKSCSTPDGQFDFNDLPEGEYFLWSNIGGGAGAVMRAVRLAADECEVVDLTSHQAR